jgi:hypothetical protein
LINRSFCGLFGKLAEYNDNGFTEESQKRHSIGKGMFSFKDLFLPSRL